MPDEQHPLGKAVHHDHHHWHDNDHGHNHSNHADHNNHVEQNNAAQIETAGDLHDHPHKHGSNIQLNMDAPGLFVLDFYKADAHPVTPYRLDHSSLSYAPAVPPPDRL